MSEIPPITIVATTYFPPGEDGRKRRDVFRQALDSWGGFLHYEGKVGLHEANDALAPGPGEELSYGIAPELFRGRLSVSHQDRRGVGASLNAGFGVAFERSPLVAYMVDDWALTEPFDLTPWARLLRDNDTIGCVRLGPPHPNLRGTILMVEHGWVFVPERQGFAFGHRPALYHQRFTDYYGLFDEGVNAFECERLYNERYARDPGGPKVVLAMPHPWQHLDSVELGDVQPEGALR